MEQGSAWAWDGQGVRSLGLGQCLSLAMTWLLLLGNRGKYPRTGHQGCGPPVAPRTQTEETPTHRWRGGSAGH